VYNFLLSDNSYSTAYGYLGCIINYMDYIGKNDLHSINVNDYTKYFSYIKRESNSYRIMVYAALKKFSAYLRANNYCDDFMQYIKRPKFQESVATKEKREKGYMTPDEVTVFINNIKNSNKKEYWKSRDLAMASVLLNTGIRCSALQKLDIHDVNINGGYINVAEKGGNQKQVTISETTITILKDWLGYRNGMKIKEDESALFISDRRSRMTKRTIYNIIKSYGLDIEGKNITPHKTRATYGTQLYNATHDLYFVQECMGHSNPKTTEIYIRGQKKEILNQASSIMDGIINKKEGEK